MLNYVSKTFTSVGVSKKNFCSQVSLAQMEYQLPRLTKMWSHLERQAGGQVKGMGEKQIEVDKRILRDQVCMLLSVTTVRFSCVSVFLSVAISLCSKGSFIVLYYQCIVQI